MTIALSAFSMTSTRQSPTRPLDARSDGRSPSLEASGEVTEFTREEEALQAYLDSQPADGRSPLNALGFVRPSQPGAFVPFVTADQQQLIQEICEKHVSNPNGLDLDAMHSELRSKGVHSEQLRETAKWFVDVTGAVVDRKGEPLVGARVDLRV